MHGNSGRLPSDGLLLGTIFGKGRFKTCRASDRSWRRLLRFALSISNMIPVADHVARYQDSIMNFSSIRKTSITFRLGALN